MTLGDTLHLEVSLQGAGNLWDAPDPLPSTAFGVEGTSFGAEAALADPSRVEVFRRRPELHLEPGSRLTVRRIFRYDIVPNEPGELAIPALALDVFDPTVAAYVRIASEGSVVDVAPRLESPSLGPAGARQPKARSAVDSGGGVGWPGSLVAIAVVLGAGVVVALRTRRRPSPAEQALALLRSGDPGAVDADALSRALRMALADRLIDREASIEEALASGNLAGPVANAAALLIDLDYSRFRRESTPPDRQAVEDALKSLGSIRSARPRWRARSPS
jgi:hypothetical protein